MSNPIPNSKSYVNNVTSNTFELYTDAGLTLTLDGTTFDAYTSGGAVTVNPLDGTGFQHTQVQANKQRNRCS